MAQEVMLVILDNLEMLEILVVVELVVLAMAAMVEFVVSVVLGEIEHKVVLLVAVEPEEFTDKTITKTVKAVSLVGFSLHPKHHFFQQETAVLVEMVEVGNHHPEIDLAV